MICEHCNYRPTTAQACPPHPQQELIQKRPQNCGTGYCSCIDCVMKPSPHPQQEPTAITDGKWYWVRYEGLGKTYEAPALYQEKAKAFYSIEFSGIPARQVEVISECQPAHPQQEPVACGWWEHISPVTGIKDVQDWQLTEADKASGWIEQPLYTSSPQRKPLNGVLVPLNVLEAVEESLGSFCSDHGWADEDMQNMDSLSAYIAEHKAAHGIKE